MENIIVVPVMLIIASVAFYAHDRFYKKSTEKLQKSLRVDYKGIKVGQVWKKDITFDPTEPLFYDVKVTGIDDKEVHYRHLEGFIVNSRTVEDFLFNATLVEDV